MKAENETGTILEVHWSEWTLVTLIILFVPVPIFAVAVGAFAPLAFIVPLVFSLFRTMPTPQSALLLLVLLLIQAFIYFKLSSLMARWITHCLRNLSVSLRKTVLIALFLFVIAAAALPIYSAGTAAGTNSSVNWFGLWSVD